MTGGQYSGMSRTGHVGPGHRWVLATCVLAHLALIGWLAQPPGSVSASDVRLQVIFIETTVRATPVPVPPFPRAPQRLERGSRTDTPVSVPQEAMPSASVASADALLAAPPSTARLLEAIPHAARQALGEFSVPERNPVERRAAPLPGRESPFMPDAIVLRRDTTPEDVLKAVGSLFGANYDACLDSRMKINDLVARNQRIGDGELSVLIDRERRRCP